MERCYDCGEAIPEGQVYRRTVCVSSSYSSGNISVGTLGSGKSFGDRSTTSGSYGGNSSTYAKVSLCPRCDARREERARAARQAALVIMIICLVILAALIAWSLAGVSAPHLPDAPQHAERQPEPAPLKPNAPIPPPKPAPREKERKPVEPKPVEPKPAVREEKPQERELLPPPVEFPEPLPPPKAAPPTPEELARDRERRAGLYLRAAREKLEDGHKREAVGIFDEILRKFPDTAAAKEARELWEKLSRE
jgi:hypothetical protein